MRFQDEKDSYMNSKHPWTEELKALHSIYPLFWDLYDDPFTNPKPLYAYIGHSLQSVLTFFLRNT